MGLGRAQGPVTHLSRCEASLCAVGSVLCSCLRARSLASSPWQSCTPAREKQRVRRWHREHAGMFWGAPRCRQLPVLGSSWGRNRSVPPIFNTDPSCVGSAAPTVTSITLGACPAHPRAAPPSFHPPCCTTGGLPRAELRTQRLLERGGRAQADPTCSPLTSQPPLSFPSILGSPTPGKTPPGPSAAHPKAQRHSPAGGREPGARAAQPQWTMQMGEAARTPHHPTPVIRGCQPHIFFILRN